MKKIEEIQSRKVMSAYGGVQSIIETAENGSLLIDYYDKWRCFRDRIPIREPRLLHHLKSMDDYNGITAIYKIPTPDLEDIKYNPHQNDLRQTIRSNYFPGWFYCPHCRRLHTINEWKIKWEQTFPDDRRFSDNFPACYHCSRRVNRYYRRQSLEQVRFLLASADSGKVIDVPFREVWGARQQTGKVWKLDNIRTTDQELFYRSSSGSDGLQSIYVQNGEGGERIALSQIASKYIVYTNGEKKGAYRLYLRNQNNIYYPDVISSLYIPYNELDENLKNGIIDDYNKGKSITEIYNEIQNYKYAPRELKDLSEEDLQNIIDGRLDYDSQEFAYIVNPSNYGRNTLLNYIYEDFKSKKYPNIHVPFVKCIYAILRLKMTSVVPYFSRVSTPNSPIKWWDLTTNEENPQLYPKKVKSYSNNNGVDFIPGVESYGEGIFLEMDVSDINEEERAVFVHTYSHMIMKELEFQCGYPLSSMKEKLYDKNNGEEWGILIYTIGGSEGSYGGLVSLFPSDPTSDGKDSRFVRIINYAIERVKDCPNDPICGDEGGHCYACLDIPEISCYKWNQDLDRRCFIKNYNKMLEDSANNVILDD